MKVHCLFEQSGTFKNEFKKLGIDAEDYDILNDFGQTDHTVDLFKEIRGGYENKPSIFDDIGQDDLIMAFFPCTRFQSKVPLLMRGQATQQKNWSDRKKLLYSMQISEELNEMYQLLSMMVVCAIDRGLKMIIENPYTQPHYLTERWCIKPSLIDKDRTLRGDHFKKPTQFWFINCKPQNNLIWEAMEINCVYTIDQAHISISARSWQ